MQTTGFSPLNPTASKVPVSLWEWEAPKAVCILLGLGSEVQKTEGFACSPSAWPSQPKQDAVLPGAPAWWLVYLVWSQRSRKPASLALKSGRRSSFLASWLLAEHDARLPMLIQWDPSTAHLRVMFLWVRDLYKTPMASVHCPQTMPGSSCETELSLATSKFTFLLPFLVYTHTVIFSSKEFASIPRLWAGTSILMLPSTLSLPLVYLNCNVLGAGTLTLVWISIALM